MDITETIRRRWMRLRRMMPVSAPTFVTLGDHAVGRTWRGDLIFVSARDLSITPSIAMSRRWEASVERVLARELKPGMTVADVGSNVGYHTLGMAHAVGLAGRVWAFEANPEIARLLEATLRNSRFGPCVTLTAAAVSDAAGTVRLLADPLNAGSGHLDWGSTNPRYSERFDVPAVTLDEVLGEVPRLDLLRMDIEGSEGLALKGARALIERSPDLRIVTEWDPVQMRCRSDVAEVARWLAAQGFRARVIDGAKLIPVASDAMAQLPLADLLLTRSGLD